jgi:hypothetical protein
MTEGRSVEPQADACDEQRLLHDVSGAFNKAVSSADLDGVWRDFVTPVWESLDAETRDILSRLYALRLSTLSWKSAE